MNGWSRQRLGELYREQRILVWLCAVIFVNQLGFGAIVPAVPLYARGFGVSQSAIGLTIAIYGLARFLANVPTGQLADLIGRRWTLVLGEVVTVAGNLLCGFAGSYGQFLLFRFLAGAGAAMVTTSGQVILADISTRANRGRMLGAYHAVFLFAVGFGPYPGGLLAERLGLNVPFFAFAGLGAIAALLAFDKVPETRGLREKRESALGGPAVPTPAFTLQLRIIFSRIGFLLVSLLTFVQFAARTGAIFTVVPLLGALKLGLTADQIGLGLTLVAIPDLAMVYLAGVLVDRFGRKPVIVPATALAGVSVALLALAPSQGWFVVGLMLWGTAGGVAGSLPSTYAADMAPPGMNAITMSSFRMIADFGYVVGPLLLGWISDVHSGEAALFTMAGMFAASCLLFGLFAPETGVRQEPRPA